MKVEYKIQLPWNQPTINLCFFLRMQGPQCGLHICSHISGDKRNVAKHISERNPCKCFFLSDPGIPGPIYVSGLYHLLTHSLTERGL